MGGVARETFDAFTCHRALGSKFACIGDFIADREFKSGRINQDGVRPENSVRMRSDAHRRARANRA